MWLAMAHASGVWQAAIKTRLAPVAEINRPALCDRLNKKRRSSRRSTPVGSSADARGTVTRPKIVHACQRPGTFSYTHTVITLGTGIQHHILPCCLALETQDAAPTHEWVPSIFHSYLGNVASASRGKQPDGSEMERQRPLISEYCTRPVAEREGRNGSSATHPTSLPCCPELGGRTSQ